MPTHQNPRDKPLPHTGKVQNDTSKMGEQHATPLNANRQLTALYPFASRMKSIVDGFDGVHPLGEGARIIRAESTG
jgi:hypothetical protein